LEAVNGRVCGNSPTEQTVSLRHPLVAGYTSRIETERVPHADEFYLDICRESFLEGGALFPPNIVVTTEHLIREGNLLVVACGEKAHL